MPRTNNRLYDLFEVRPDASDRGIQIARDRLVERWKDKKGPEAERKRADLDFAWSVLSDAGKKALYDEFGERAFGPGFNLAAERQAQAELRKDDPEAAWAESKAAGHYPPGFGSAGGPPPGYGAGGPPPGYPPPGWPPQPPPGWAPPAGGAPPGPPPGWPPPGAPQGAYPYPYPPPWGWWPPPPGYGPPPPGYGGAPGAPGAPAANVPAGPVEVWIPFRTMVYGGKHETLLGNDVIDIPIVAGVESGTTVIHNGRTWIMRIEDSESFTRDGSDLHTAVTIDQAQAARGEAVTVQLPDGKAVKAPLQDGDEDDQVLVVPGKGVQVPGKAGDLYVTVRIRRSGMPAHGRAPLRPSKK